MKPAAQFLLGVAAVVALMTLNALVEFVAARPVVWTLTMTTVALAGVARLLYVTARPR